jgi:hypothetical protein
MERWFLESFLTCKLQYSMQSFFRFEMKTKTSKHFLQKQLILSSCRAQLLLSFTHTGFSLNFREKKYLCGTFSQKQIFSRKYAKISCHKKYFHKSGPPFSQVVTFCNKGRKLNICLFSRTFSPTYERKWSKMTFANFFANMHKRKFPFEPYLSIRYQCGSFILCTVPQFHWRNRIPLNLTRMNIRI